MTGLFVDTAYYLALLNSDDEMHSAAVTITPTLTEKLVTTRNLTRALTSDHHFEQAGYQALLK